MHKDDEKAVSIHSKPEKLLGINSDSKHQNTQQTVSKLPEAMIKEAIGEVDISLASEKEEYFCPLNGTPSQLAE